MNLRTCQTNQTTLQMTTIRQVNRGIHPRTRATSTLARPTFRGSLTTPEEAVTGMVGEEMEKFLRGIGATRIVAFVRKSHVASLRVLEKTGFQREDLRVSSHPCRVIRLRHTFFKEDLLTCNHFRCPLRVALFSA
jgi:hypothetical protein